MSLFRDPKIAASKASPFVFHETKAKPTVHQPNAAKPVTSTSKVPKAPSQPVEGKKHSDSEPLVLTVKEVAAWLKYSEKKIYEYIANGILKPLPGSRSYRIPVIQVKALCGG